jgi:hypothetical protein
MRGKLRWTRHRRGVCAPIMIRLYGNHTFRCSAFKDKSFGPGLGAVKLIRFSNQQGHEPQRKKQSTGLALRRGVLGRGSQNCDIWVRYDRVKPKEFSGRGPSRFDALPACLLRDICHAEYRGSSREFEHA